KDDDKEILHRKRQLLTSLMALQEGLKGDPLIKAVSPNWVTVAGQGFGDSGGPGGRPVPPDSAKLAKLTSGDPTSYQFWPNNAKNPHSTTWWQIGSKSPKVIVAMLDSAPTPKVLADAQESIQGGVLKNPLLDELIGSNWADRATPQGYMVD